MMGLEDQIQRFSSLRVTDLKALLSKASLPTSGRKAELVQRLAEYEETKVASEQNDASSDKGSLEGDASEKTGSNNQPPLGASETEQDNERASKETENQEEQLGTMTVVQLKEELKARGEPVAGRKADLVQRIIEHDAHEEEAMEHAVESAQHRAEESDSQDQPTEPISTGTADDDEHSKTEEKYSVESAQLEGEKVDHTKPEIPTDMVSTEQSTNETRAKPEIPTDMVSTDESTNQTHIKDTVTDNASAGNNVVKSTAEYDQKQDEFDSHSSNESSMQNKVQETETHNVPEPIAMKTLQQDNSKPNEHDQVENTMAPSDHHYSQSNAASASEDTSKADNIQDNSISTVAKTENKDATKDKVQQQHASFKRGRSSSSNDEVKFSDETEKHVSLVDSPEMAHKKRKVTNSDNACSILVQGLQRPFTRQHLFEKLESYGKLNSSGPSQGLWLQRFKKYAVATFESAESATAALSSLHGAKWPSHSQKVLQVEFATHSADEIADNGDPYDQSASMDKVPAIVDSTPAVSPEEPEDLREDVFMARNTTTLNKLFRQTEALPRLYYLPLNDKQIDAKRKRQEELHSRGVVLPINPENAATIHQSKNSMSRDRHGPPRNRFGNRPRGGQRSKRRFHDRRGRVRDPSPFRRRPSGPHGDNFSRVR